MAFQVSMSCRAVVLPPAFPPSLVVRVKALACELPHRLGLPLSRLSLAEIRRHVVSRTGCGDQRCHLVAVAEQRCVAALATSQLDFPADPEFAAKAGRVLDLYE